MEWVALGVGIVLLVGVWAPLAVLYVSRRPKQDAARDDKKSKEFPWLAVLLITGWANGVVPSLLQILFAGRPALDVSVVSTPVPIAAAAARFLTLLFMVVSGAAVFLRHGRKPATGIASVCVFLAPWAAVHLSAFLAGQPIKQSALLFPLAALAVWRIAPPLGHLKILGLLTVLTATVSLALGWLAPTKGNIPAPTTGDKSQFNGLLAGVYNHPNTLGMALALGLPAVILFTHRKWRVLGIVIVSVAAALAASRTAAFAIGAELVLMVLLSRTARYRRLLSGVAMMVMAVVVVRTPLIAGPSDYTERGQIWLASREVWPDHLWTGMGPSFYRDVALFVNDFGRLAFHGHNIFVHMMTVAGIIGVMAIGLVLAASARVAFCFLDADQIAPAVYLVGFLGIGWLEVANDFRDLSTLGFAVWLPLAVFMFSRDHTHMTGAETVLERPERKSAQYAAESI